MKKLMNSYMRKECLGNQSDRSFLAIGSFFMTERNRIRQKETGSSKVISHCFNPSLLTINASGATLDPQQFPNQPTKFSEIDNHVCCLQEFCFECVEMVSTCLKCRIQQEKTSYAEHQRAYCFKCFSDGIDPQQRHDGGNNFDDSSYFQISCSRKGFCTAEEKA